MDKLNYIIAGVILIIIGVIIIYGRNIIVASVLNSKKEADKVLGKIENDNYSFVMYEYTSKVIVVVIGVGLFLMGILSIVMAM